MAKKNVCVATAHKARKMAQESDICLVLFVFANQLEDTFRTLKPWPRLTGGKGGNFCACSRNTSRRTGSESRAKCCPGQTFFWNVFFGTLPWCQHLTTVSSAESWPHLLQDECNESTTWQYYPFSRLSHLVYFTTIFPSRQNFYVRSWSWFEILRGCQNPGSE